MFDGRWSELLLIAFIAIVVVGPKDLPKLMVQVGRWTRAAQRAAREFQLSLEQLAEEAEAKEVTRDLRALGRSAKDALNDTPPSPAPEHDPTRVAPPPLSVLPPEGGSFRPPSEEDEAAPLPKTGSSG